MPPSDRNHTCVPERAPEGFEGVRANIGLGIVPNCSTSNLVFPQALRCSGSLGVLRQGSQTRKGAARTMQALPMHRCTRD